MCLYVNKKNQVRAALEDIVCYKVTAGAYTQYIGYPISPSVRFGLEPFKASRRAKRYIEKLHDEYNEGFIHTYTSLQDAIYRMRGSVDADVLFLYKCIIPRGTKYILGFDSSQTASYGSKQIIFLERIM